MKFLDPNDPFFARAWVRWITVLVPLGWAGVEFWQGAPMCVCIGTTTSLGGVMTVTGICGAFM